MSVDFSDYSVEVFIEAKNTLGEGPIWWKSRSLLVWVDILECKIFAATLEGEIVEIMMMPEPVGCIFEMPDGSLLAGCQTGLRTVPTGELIARIPDASPDMRINDGKVDPWGNLVFGTMGYPEPQEEAGVLWRWDGNDFTALLEGLTIPNGMVWRNQGSEFLFIDTPTKSIRAYRYDVNNDRLSDFYAVIDLSSFDGDPDGMCEGANGELLVAMWDGHAVICIYPSGAVAKLGMPCSRPTSILPVVSFPSPSEEDSSSTFVVTSARLESGGNLYVLAPKRQDGKDFVSLGMGPS